MTAPVQALRKELQNLADETIAAHSLRFFKTGPGEYGEGDQFLGIRMPVLRGIAKKNGQLQLSDVESLLHSPIHEERMLALLILVLQYGKADSATSVEIYDAYCRNLAFVNGWDLVDCSAHLIVGPHLRDRSRKQLHRWAKSKDLWERRVAVIATFAYIKEDEFDETLKLAAMLVNDQEDLIHKAVGWMLREIGKRDRQREEQFLALHYQTMPRTMLRYAIEKFPESKRQRYLAGKI